MRTLFAYLPGLARLVILLVTCGPLLGRARGQSSNPTRPAAFPEMAELRGEVARPRVERGVTGLALGDRDPSAKPNDQGRGAVAVPILEPLLAIVVIAGSLVRSTRPHLAGPWLSPAGRIFEP